MTVDGAARGRRRGQVEDDGENREVQGAPGCVTVKVCRRSSAFPCVTCVRCSRRRCSVTVPLPVPLAPALIVIHASLLVAVQLQPAPAVTPTFPVAAMLTAESTTSAKS